MTASTILTPATTAVPPTVTTSVAGGDAWTPAAVADLADRLSVDGPAAHAASLSALAAWACERDVAPALLTVLTDPQAPAVARLRAFARVASAVRSVPAWSAT